MAPDIVTPEYIRTRKSSLNASWLPLSGTFKMLLISVLGFLWLFGLPTVVRGGDGPGSFYDNPELDPIPVGGSRVEELERKWAFEVRKIRRSLRKRVMEGY